MKKIYSNAFIVKEKYVRDVHCHLMEILLFMSISVMLVLLHSHTTIMKISRLDSQGIKVMEGLRVQRRNQECNGRRNMLI
jgi:hypothetical protein